MERYFFSIAPHDCCRPEQQFYPSIQPFSFLWIQPALERHPLKYGVRKRRSCDLPHNTTCYAVRACTSPYNHRGSALQRRHKEYAYARFQLFYNLTVVSERLSSLSCLRISRIFNSLISERFSFPLKAPLSTFIL